MNSELVSYLRQQMHTSEERLQRFTHSSDGKELPKRYMFYKIQEYADSFIKKELSNRMVIIPGFRGVGKTTLMAQLCMYCKEYTSVKFNYLFVSIEDSMSFFESGVLELMAAYEEILGSSLSSVTDPVFIFLDEIQSDPKWAITLKSLFERTTNVFFCCSGSSAVVIQSTSDLARRAIFEKLPPMSFTEYEMTKNRVDPPEGLGKEIVRSLYFSDSAEQAYDALYSLQSRVHQYWTCVDRLDVQEYLSYGSLPFSFGMQNEGAIYDSIALLLDKVVKTDLPMLNSFDEKTLSSIKRLLFAIAENDVTSLYKLEEKLEINRATITNVFDALEKAEILIKVPAYGANMTIAKKPSKYLFMSPAIRMSFFYFTGIENTYMVRQGKLLEDSIGSHLYREFIMKGQGAIRYDSQEGGADFALQVLNKRQLIIEVGLGNKNQKQIITSAKKISSDYNIVFSRNELSIDRQEKTIFVPLDCYFLM